MFFLFSKHFVTKIGQLITVQNDHSELFLLYYTIRKLWNLFEKFFLYFDHIVILYLRCFFFSYLA